MDMIGKIRRPHRRDHLSEREIARKTGLSRNTVSKWLHAEVQAPPKYQRSAQVCKISAFEETIKQVLKADARRPSHERRTAQAQFAEIKAAGYSGGYKRGQHRRWVFPVYRRDTKTADASTGKICNHAWRKACVRAGVPELRFHDLRHTWASWHTMAGTPAMVLKELGGWASLAMVERYTHLSPGHLAAWADRVSVSNLEQVPELGAQSTQRDVGKSAQVKKKSLGWLMGLEPTTTGITILDSTN